MIISALTSAELQPYRSTGEFQAAMDLLPSRQQRNTARRAAVLVSWVRSIRQADMRQWQQSMGGITFPVHEYPLLGYYFDLGERNKEAIVAAAIAALGDQSSPGEESWQRSMHALVAPPGVRFELGPYSSRFRDLPALQVLRMEMTYPARYWGMDWERQLENLKTPPPAPPSRQNGETNQ